MPSISQVLIHLFIIIIIGQTIDWFLFKYFTPQKVPTFVKALSYPFLAFFSLFASFVFLSAYEAFSASPEKFSDIGRLISLIIFTGIAFILYYFTFIKVLPENYYDYKKNKAQDAVIHLYMKKKGTATREEEYLKEISSLSVNEKMLLEKKYKNIKLKKEKDIEEKNRILLENNLSHIKGKET